MGPDGRVGGGIETGGPDGVAKAVGMADGEVGTGVCAGVGRVVEPELVVGVAGGAEHAATRATSSHVSARKWLEVISFRGPGRPSPHGTLRRGCPLNR